MADKTIGDLTAASTPDGTELIELEQGGNSRKADLATSLTGTITAATLKASPVLADSLAILDSEASGALKKTTVAGFLSSFVSTFGSFINNQTTATTIADGNYLPYTVGNSVDDGRKITWANIKATLKTYFDTLYASKTLSITAKTAAYTFALTDAGKGFTMSASTTQAFTVPANSSVAFPTGTRIDVAGIGTGTVNVTGAAGVTINGVTATAIALDGQYAGASLWKTGTDTWLLFGKLA